MKAEVRRSPAPQGRAKESPVKYSAGVLWTLLAPFTTCIPRKELQVQTILAARFQRVAW
jgi:hypothetical protein